MLVNFGGSDPAHACLYTVASILKAQLYKEYEITVYSGISNPDHDKITELLKDIREIKHFRHCNDILKEFEKTDLAVGACGGMFVEEFWQGCRPSMLRLQITRKDVAICKKF